MKINIITLPPGRWQECRALRLQALKTNPESFARTYEEDAALLDEQWIQWLKDGQEGKKSYLLFAENEEGKLVGMVGALLGKGVTPHYMAQNTAQVIAMYVDPAFRSRGIGRQLMQALLDKLLANADMVQVSLGVNVSALPAVHLYEDLAFKTVETLKKAMNFDHASYDLYAMVKMLK